MSFASKVRSFFTGRKYALGPLSLILGAYGEAVSTKSGDPWTLERAMKEGFAGSLWVYRCVSVIMTCVGHVRWHVIDDKTGLPIVGHAIENLFNRPSPYIPTSNFFQLWAAHLLLAGQAYWEIVVGTNKQVLQFLPLRPDWMDPTPDPDKYISKYTFYPNGIRTDKNAVHYKPEEIADFKAVNPTKPWLGFSPLTPAEDTLAMDKSATEWNKNLYKNSAVPSGVLSVPAASMDDEEREKIEASVKKNYSEHNLARPMVLWGGMEWQQISLSPENMGIVTSKEANKFDICALYGVPAAIAGANQDPTYQNYGVSRAALWEDTVFPLLRMIEDFANYRILPRLPGGDKIHLAVDLTTVPAMAEILTRKVDTAGKLFRMNYPINDITRVLDLGMKQVKWGDTAFVNATMITAETAMTSLSPSVSNDPSGEPKDDLSPDLQA